MLVDQITRFETESVDDDQCCLASLSASTLEEENQLLGACDYDRLTRSKYLYNEDDEQCFFFEYTVDTWATSEEFPVEARTVDFSYDLADRDNCCLYSNRGDYNLAACDSIPNGDPVVTYELDSMTNMCEQVTTTPILYILPGLGSERRIPGETVERDGVALELCD